MIKVIIYAAIKGVRKWYVRDRKIIIMSLLIGVSAMVLSAFASAEYAEKTQGAIAKEVIRLHILANSDEEHDQLLKIKVRDAVMLEMKGLLTGGEDLSETKEILSQNLNLIEFAAIEIIHENGYSYNVTAKITTDIFPTKVYGDAAFPAGKYEALRIEIGEGKGKNWWCLMFPPLCFIDVTQAELPIESKDELKNVLTDEEYGLVIDSQNENELPFKVKFKIVEIWQKIKNSFF